MYNQDILICKYIFTDIYIFLNTYTDENIFVFHPFKNFYQ